VSWSPDDENYAAPAQSLPRSAPISRSEEEAFRQALGRAGNDYKFLSRQRLPERCASDRLATDPGERWCRDDPDQLKA
jgi:hypothetical protein